LQPLPELSWWLQVFSLFFPWLASPLFFSSFLLFSLFFSDVFFFLVCRSWPKCLEKEWSVVLLPVSWWCSWFFSEVKVFAWYYDLLVQRKRAGRGKDWWFMLGGCVCWFLREFPISKKRTPPHWSKRRMCMKISAWNRGLMHEINVERWQCKRGLQRVGCVGAEKKENFIYFSFIYYYFFIFKNKRLNKKNKIKKS